MASNFQAGQKRPSQGVEITPGPGQAELQPESEPAPKRAKIEASAAESSDESDNAASPPVSQAGWNRSVGTGLRTSFGPSAKLKLQKMQIDDTKSPSPEPQDDKASAVEDDKFSAVEKSPEPPKEAEEAPKPGRGNILAGWKIPKRAFNTKFAKKPNRKKGDSWERRLSNWYLTVADANPDKEGLKEPTVFLEVWRQWLKNQIWIASSIRDLALSSTTVEALGTDTINTMIASLAQPRNNSLEQKPKPPQTYGWHIPPTIDPASFDLPVREVGPWIEMFVSWFRELVKLNPNLFRPKHGLVGKKMEERVGVVYRSWVATHDASKRKITVAGKAAIEAFGTQGQRINGILASKGRSTDTNQTSEVIILSSSSEGEVSEGEEESTSPSPWDQSAAPSGIADSIPGPVLFNWSRGQSSASSGANGSSQLPELPVMPLVAEPVKLMSTKEELAYRSAYYPGVLPSDVFCVNCVNHGHTTRKCPLLTCRWCGIWGHPYLRCPTRHRCTKCRQLGHEAGNCTEKLVLPRDQMDCARCGAKDHLENACYEIFRSTFNPPPERIRKVKALPIYCAKCGSQGHYWTECGLNAARLTDVDKDGLNAANTIELYVDPTCDNLAICYQGTSGYQIGRSAGTEGRPAHLSGKSIAPKRHVEYFEDDDDDDEVGQFIRPPPQKRQPLSGKITFSSFSSSNNRGGGGNPSRGGGQSRGGRYNNGYSNGNGRANPPLPPGPPPPPTGPKAGQGSRRGRGGRRGGRGGY